MNNNFWLAGQIGPLAHRSRNTTLKSVNFICSRVITRRDSGWASAHVGLRVGSPFKEWKFELGPTNIAFLAFSPVGIDKSGQPWAQYNNSKLWQIHDCQSDGPTCCTSIQLFNRFVQQNYHSSLFTTFGLDIDGLEMFHPHLGLSK